MKERCETCRFFAVRLGIPSANVRITACVRRAPKSEHMLDSSNPAIWPDVSEHDWCGDWEAMDTKPQDYKITIECVKEMEAAARKSAEYYRGLALKQFAEKQQISGYDAEGLKKDLHELYCTLCWLKGATCGSSLVDLREKVILAMAELTAIENHLERPKE